MPEDAVFAGRPETRIYDGTADGKKAVDSVLLGTWLNVFEKADGWLSVDTGWSKGWVKQDETRDDSGLKLFFIDVGQGDCCLIEAPGKRVMVDGGPDWHTRGYLNWHFRTVFEKREKAHFDAVFVSHFDDDHYAGLVKVLEDQNYEVGTLYHNGIARFSTKKSDRPEGLDTDLGKTETRENTTALTTTFSTLKDAKKLIDGGGLQAGFRKFLEAAIKANSEGRLGSMKQLTSMDGRLDGFSDEAGLAIDVLGPVPLGPDGQVSFPWFTDSSKTRNGHSVVLRLSYKGKTILLGGDLNSESQRYLLECYKGKEDAFRADVSKCAHHGSQDYTVDFLKAVSPYASVISSGDNESYSHPRADAVGSVGRYSRGTNPLVFSTELARSYSKGKDLMYGMINLRTDGDLLVMAQMKEKRIGADVWDSYKVPFKPGKK